MIERDRSRFTAIIVHFGESEQTLRLAGAMLDYGLQVLVVANDLSPRPAGLDTSVGWIQPERNLGYAAAFNAAVREAPGAFGYLLLNMDVSVPIETVDKCLDVLEMSPKVGVCGPRLMKGDSLQHGPGTLAGLGSMPRKAPADAHRTKECRWVTGAVMLVRGSVAREVPMHEGYFLGCEDVDYCLRVAEAGYSTVFVGEAEAQHVGGEVIGALWYYYAARNRLWFARENRSFLVFVLLWLAHFVLTFRVLAADVVRARGLVRTRYHALALADAIRAMPRYGEPARPDEPRPLHDSVSGPALGTQLAVAIGNIGILMLGLGSGIVAARWLGPHSRGVYVSAASWAAFVGVVASLGVPQSVVLDHGATARLTRPILGQVAIGLLTSVLVGVLLPLNGGSRLNIDAVAGFALLSAGSIAGGTASGLMQRRGRMVGGFQFVRLAPPAAIVLSMLALIVFGSHDPSLWLLATGLAAFVAGAVSLAFSVEWPGRQSVRTWWYDRSFVRVSAGTFAVALLTQVVYREDILISSLRMAPARVADYAIAAAGLSACITAAQAAGMVLFSRLRNLRPELVVSAVVGAVVSALIGATMAVVPLVLLAPWLVPTIYGSAFDSAVEPVQILAIGAIALAIDFALASAILATGHVNLLIWMRVAQAAIAIPVLLTPAILGSTARFATARSGLYVLECATLGVAFWATQRGPSVNVDGAKRG